MADTSATPRRATPLPTPAEIAALVAYLPRLYAPGFTPVLRWEGGTRNAAGVLQMPWPEYDPLVSEFYRAAAAECWTDYAYTPETASRMLHTPGLVEAASLAQIKTMLTYCRRGERFSDGHWAEMIEAGHIRRLLMRLAELGAGGGAGT